MSQKKIGVILSYIQILATILVNLIYTPLMLRLVGVSEYGVYSLSSSVIGYLSLLYAGMTSTYLRYSSIYQKKGDQESVARLNGLFVVLFSALGCCALILGILLSANLQPVLGNGLTAHEYELARILFIIMAINMALLMPKTVFSTLIISQERFIFIKSLDVLHALLIPVLTLPVLYFGYGSIGMSCVVLFLTGIGLVASMWYCLRKMNCPFCFRNLPFSLLPGMFSFSIFILLQGIMDQFNWHLGKVLLSNFADSTAIAVYSIGVQIDSLFISFGVAFSGVVVPRIYQLVRENATQELTELWLKVGRYQFYVVYFIWLGFLFFGKPFIVLWAGESYQDAYIVTLLLMTPLLLHMCQLLAVEVLRAYDKHRVWTLVHLASAIAGFLICIPLTKEYGILGVSAGTCVTMFLAVNFYDNWYYAKYGQLNVLFFFRGMVRLLPAALLCMLFAWGLSNVLTIITWSDILLVGTLYTVLYAGVMFLAGMNAQERDIIVTMIRRVGLRINWI